jgi:hypothetical protein
MARAFVLRLVAAVALAFGAGVTIGHLWLR